MATKKPLTMSELKKQLERERKKEEKKEAKHQTKESKPKLTGMAASQAARQTKIRAKEEDARRKFFTKIVKEQNSLSQEDLLDKLEKFGKEPKSQLFRKDFVKRIATRLSAGLIYEYAQGYLNQSEPSNVYLKKFLESPDVKQRIEIMAGRVEEREEREEEEEGYETEEEKEEQDEVQQMAQDLEEFLLEDDEERVKYTPPPGPAKVAKLVDTETLEEIEKPVRQFLEQYAKMENKRCMEWYRNTPWLEGRATAIWVNPSDWDADYYHIDDRYKNSKMIDGILYHRANDKFIKAQCGFYRNRRTQKGDELTFYDESGNQQQVKVVFEVRGKFIPQTEEMFQEEKDAYFQSNAPLIKKIDKLSDRTVIMLSEEEKHKLKKTMREYFKSLTSVLTNKDEEVKETAKEVVDVFFQKEGDGSVKLLLEKFSLFLAYFDDTFLSYAKTFKERFSKGVYSPEVLINLTYTDVLPEVYLDPRVDSRNREIFTRFLSITAREIYVQLSYNFYYELNPKERRVVIPMKSPFIGDAELPEDGLRGLCKNKDMIPKNISPYNLYIYQDGDEFYCFDLSNLPENLKLYGDNPETGEALPENVLDEIINLSQKYQAEKEVVLPPTTEAPKDMLALAFLRLVIDDITDLENEIGIKGKDLLKELEVAKQEEEKQPSAETTAKVERLTEKVENICGYCQKFLSGEQAGIFSSIIQGKDGSKLIDFCNIECFEKMKKWPKLRKRMEQLEEQSRARMLAQEGLEKPPKIIEEQGWPEKLPCFYPGECETNPAFSDNQIRQIAEECDVPLRTSKGGLRIRSNLCKDIKEKTQKPEEEFTCERCEKTIVSGHERNLKEKVFCRKCFDVETIPFVQEILKEEVKREKEKEKICVKCEKFIGDNPAWRSSDWGHGIVHYCSLKCFQEFDPDTVPKVKKAKEIEEEKLKKLEEIIKKSNEFKKPRGLRNNNQFRL